MARRYVTALFLLPAAVLLAGTGCKKKRPAPPTETAEPTDETAPPPGLVVSFVYAGPKGDGGFNQAHARGAAAVARLPGVKLIESENVPEDSSALGRIETLVALKETALVFTTAWSHFDPPVLTLAPKYPKVSFRHFGGYYQEGVHPANAASFHGYLDEAFYVSGVVAGLSSKTGKLGFVAAKPLPHIVRSVNAFTLGAQSVNPKVTTIVRFTGSWSDAAAEESAANALVDSKVDVLAMYVNAPQLLLQTAERRGIQSVGVHVNGIEHAPRGYLTGAEWNLEPLYVEAVKAAKTGKKVPHVVRGGLADGYVNISPFGPAVSESVRKKALWAREQLIHGKLTILKGPLKDNVGRTVIPAGNTMAQKDLRLETMSYLVHGVVKPSAH